VRCDDCQSKPAGESQYCECCGKRVPAHEEKGADDTTTLAAPAPDAAPPVSEAKPAPVVTPGERPILSVTAHESTRTRSMLVAAASIAIVAAIGFPLGTYWRGRNEAHPTATEQAPPKTVVSQPAVAERREEKIAKAPAAARGRAEAKSAKSVKPAAAAQRHEAPAPKKAERPSTKAPLVAKAAAKPLSPQPKPASPQPKPSAAPKAVRPVTTPAPQAAPVVASNPAPAPVVEEAPPAPVAVPTPAPEPAPPMGRFFEMRHVSQWPQVTARVEPQVPEELKNRQLNEIVIVRVLVSQAGHPSLVNVLRGSKAGPVLDDAVVAAVKQWNFTPALKDGAAVSCFYHVGVPVGRTN
jgi:TonB family protein